MKKIEIPSKICSDFNGYSFFSNLNKALESFRFEKIELDFSFNTWFEANLCSALGALINKSNSNFNQVFINNLGFKQEEIFRKNHFLASFGGFKIQDYNDTTIKYRKSRITEDKRIKDFLDKELIGKPDFPKLSNAARSEIIRSIFEIYSNAIIHGGCKEVYSCGQFYPQKRPPRIDFTIVDIGHTIKKNVNEFLASDFNGVEAIIWALAENNTTKPKENNIPGGLGLKLIEKFVSLNKGKLQIVSSDGFWELNKGKQNASDLDYPFPGTLVNLEFNLDDDSFYYLKEEEPEPIIF